MARHLCRASWRLAALVRVSVDGGQLEPDEPRHRMTDDPNAFGLWEGEVATDLPGDFDASLYYVGRIHTPWKQRKDCPKNARESEAVCTIEVDPRWAPALKDVESCSHLVVLYWMDRSRRDIVLQVPAALRGAARHLLAALAGAAQSHRHERGAAAQGRGQQAVGGGPRLPRRHAAPRPQALFRLDRRGARRRGRLAQGAART